MDKVTIITFFCMILLIITAVVLVTQKRKANSSKSSQSSSQSGLVSLLASLAALCYIILVYMNVFPVPGLAANTYRLSLGGAVSIVGLVYLFLGILYLSKQYLRGLSVLLFLATALCCIGLLYTESSFIINRAGWALYLHLFLSLCAYAFLSFAAVLTIIEPWQSRQLRLNPSKTNALLPPLESLDTQTFNLITIGFSLLSLALLTGFFFLEDMLSQRLNHKVVLSLLSWLVFAVLLLGRWRLGWRGKTAMRLALLGFILLLLSYFGSKWVLEILLNRSWS